MDVQPYAVVDGGKQAPPQIIPDLPEPPEGYRISGWSWVDSERIMVNFVAQEPVTVGSPETMAPPEAE